ncbi:glycoside hydrolase [Pseudomassariella vexata]|uniref:alpha-1,2-Mannosidase n=1 Tax=Pseudomassariella vexata TaxID=1141098 RepID=A0A1Y2E889_9PEZI|nr:glycoside hydrolase [Pseudomassariella vexata]ORY67770.1 glycoside hydrolase [Pseudomassariella vexata]
MCSPILCITVLIVLLCGTTSGAQHSPTNTTLAYPKQRGAAYDYTTLVRNQTTRADGVVEMFRVAWSGYVTYAFPHDQLRPQSNNYTDPFNGWGVTAIDALDTAIIMEQTDIVTFILDYVPSINFTRTNTPEPTVVSLFETNIRYLGGMLSAYDLLKGPFAHLGVDESKVDVLLAQSQSLADALKFAFDTPTGIPVNRIFLENHTFSDIAQMADGTQTAGLAELGTLVLEWQRLSDLTGDPSYGNLAQKAETYFLTPSIEVWPGLTGGNFSTQTGEILDAYGGWTSGNDSAYEYLIKMYVYDPDRYALYGDRFAQAVNSTIAHLLSHPSSRPDLTVAAVFAGTQTQNESDSLSCFMGGSFILGSSALQRPEWLPVGLDLAEWCANGYRYAASGIGPTLYSWDTDELANPNNTNQTDLYSRAGWFIPLNYYAAGQAPEAVESWYYAYQATGDQYWRDVAWRYTLDLNRTQRVESGFAAVLNVLEVEGGGNGVNMQSFLLAEVFKYMFLVQSENKGEWDVLHGGENGEKKNCFVYNTEAHPVRVAAKNPV